VAWNLGYSKFGMLVAAEIDRINYGSKSIGTSMHLPFVEDGPAETSATV
jgi:hypothetical protein